MAKTEYFLTETNMDEKKSSFYSETDDAGQFLNIESHPVLPFNCHLFLRNEPPSRITQTKYKDNLHHHHILWFCLSGRGCLTVNKTPYILGSGEAILIPPGQAHGRRPLDNEKVQWLLVRFTLKDEPAWLTLLTNQIFCFEGEIGKLLDEFRQSCARYHSGQELDQEVIAGECLLRLGLLINALRPLAAVSPVTAAEEQESTLIKQLCQQFVGATGIKKKFSEIAREHNISPGHLRRLFKQATGGTPSYARYNELLIRSERLLSHSHLNISEIALRLGFGSIYAFSRFYKKQRGISPLQFRKKVKSGGLS